MAAGVCDARAFSLLLVQDWLVACRFESTARCLVDEWMRSEQNIPARSVWNHMVENLGFDSRTPASIGTCAVALLEDLVRKSVVQHKKEIARRLPPQQVVLVSKTREQRFVSKKSLPRSWSATSSKNITKQVQDLSSLNRSRPKSAVVCTDLSAKTSTSRCSTSMVSITGRPNLRPVSAASALQQHQERPKVLSTAKTAVRHDTVEAISPIAGNAAIGGQCRRVSEITSVSKEVNSEGASLVPIQSAPKLSLEEMSEERLMEQFGSISRCAIKKLRRVLAKSHAYSQEFEKSQRTVDKIKARATLRQMRRVLAEEQTALLSSTMTSLLTEPCSLCLYVFPKKTLTTKVSYKSIEDLRAMWARTNQDGGTSSSDETMSHARITHLYDEAPVCAFCSQLLLDFSSYRPSSSEHREQQTQGHHETVKYLKVLEAKERHNLEQCNPLDYQSYELNTDDDDSDVEEIIAVTEDMRPQVVRRQRNQPARIPVPLGVVSRRLHYDKLRSDSIDMLTLNEWQKIMH